MPVATPAALIAMKLHAFQDRNDDRKRASDAWDLYRLIDLNRDDTAFGGTFASAPDALLELMGRGIEQAFLMEVTRTRRWIVVYGDADWAAQATEDALADAANAILAAIR